MSFIYQTINQLVIGLLAVLHPLHPKVGKGYRLRRKQQGLYPWLKFEKHSRPVWFHCASGEFEYALPLIRRIKQENPQQKVIVTYFTPSYAERIAREPLVDFVCPAPWDSPGVMREFLAHHRPRMLLIARTDAWFEMTRQSQKAGVPVAIFSMTFNKRLNFLSRLYYRWRFSHVDRFFVVSEEDKNLLRTVVPSDEIQISGDTRYEQCLHRLSQAAPELKIRRETLQRNVFLAGSTWPEDEAVLIPAMARHPDLCHWILVPHEVDSAHIQNLKESLKSAGFSPVLFSEISQWDGSGPLVVDQVGLLAHLYPLADVSFIGGSYRKQVHSVMESLASGRVTLVGPHCRNSREAVEFSHLPGFSLTPVQICEASQLEDKLHTVLKKWSTADSEKLKSLVRERSRVSEPLWNQLQHELLKLYS